MTRKNLLLLLAVAFVLPVIGHAQIVPTGYTMHSRIDVPRTPETTLYNISSAQLFGNEGVFLFGNNAITLNNQQAVGADTALWFSPQNYIARSNNGCLVGDNAWTYCDPHFTNWQVLDAKTANGTVYVVGNVFSANGDWSGFVLKRGITGGVPNVLLFPGQTLTPSVLVAGNTLHIVSADNYSKRVYVVDANSMTLTATETLPGGGMYGESPRVIIKVPGGRLVGGIKTGGIGLYDIYWYRTNANGQWVSAGVEGTAAKYEQLEDVKIVNGKLVTLESEYVFDQNGMVGTLRAAVRNPQTLAVEWEYDINPPQGQGYLTGVQLEPYTNGFVVVGNTNNLNTTVVRFVNRKATIDSPRNVTITKK